MSKPMRLRLGIDIGGTFTDIVMFDESSGQFSRAKTPSTPGQPEIGFMRALEAIGAEAGDISRLVHGTTIVTNLLLERKGARIALITTKGFGDVLEIMRATRPLPYDLHWRKPTPVVPRALCFELDERLDAAGNVVRAPDSDAVERLLETILSRDVDGVAVCFLHSYVNDAHERMVEEIIRARHPDLPVSISAKVCREIREYERANTTAVNAYAMPSVARYVRRLDELIGRPGLVTYLSSEGGMQPAGEVAERPISLCLSGPAGGVLGGQMIGELTGRSDLITIDMGGTSFDVALIRRGRVEIRNVFEVDWGLPVKTPAIDIKTIGAGGGSIVWVDEGGALRVGPQSAGADPGPACYGRGGEDCTVTDANVVLGLINPSGDFRMDRLLAEAAVGRIAVRFGLSVEETALGIYRVVNASMAAAIRQMTVEKGIDPRHFTLLAFGGAGGQHAAALAQEVGVRDILVPAMSSVFSAFGMVNAPRKTSRATSVMSALKTLGTGDIERIFAPLADDLDLVVEGDPGSGRLEYALDLRYVRQAHELTVGVGLDWSVERIAASFEERHRELYGTALAHDLMVVTARLTYISAQGSAPPPARRRPDDPGPRRYARVFGIADDVPLFDRASLPADLVGPCLVEESDTSFWIPAGAVATEDQFGNLLVRLDEARTR